MESMQKSSNILRRPQTFGPYFNYNLSLPSNFEKRVDFFWSSQKIWTLACDSKEGFNWPKLQKISSMFPDGKPVETLKLLSLTQGHQNLINSYLQLILQFYESIPIMNARQLPDKLPPSMSPWSFQLLSCPPSTTGLALWLLLLRHS